MDLHLPHVVHLLDSEWNLYHQHLVEIYIVIYGILIQSSLLINDRPRREGIRRPARYRSPEIPYKEQIKLCARHPHEKPQREFIDSKSNEEFDTCNQCRQEMQLYRRRIQELQDELERALTEHNLEINENEDQGPYLT
jgi:hypothetical protein